MELRLRRAATGAVAVTRGPDFAVSPVRLPPFLVSLSTTGEDDSTLPPPQSPGDGPFRALVFLMLFPRNIGR